MPVVQYQIPDIYKPGFITFSKLSSQQFDNLKKIINESKIGDNEEAFGVKLSEILNLSPDEGKVFAITIYSLFGLLLNSTSSVSEIAESLAGSLKAVAPEATEENITQLNDRIIRTLDEKSSIFYTIKSRTLFNESFTVFEDTRIITDIRLTFDNSSVEYGYKGGIVIHNLKLVTRENEELNSFFISCLGKDLKKLKEVIDRALEKEKTIKEGNLNKEITFVDIK